MPELRQDPIVGRWVIISLERARRPGNFIDPIHRHRREYKEHCNLCDQPQEPIYTRGGISVISYRGPTLSTSRPSAPNGFYEVIKDVGIHETVIETPEHIPNMADLPVSSIKEIIKTYVDRLESIKENILLRYALVYKNYGLPPFAYHACSHIMAVPVPSLEMTEKFLGARQYFEQHQRCVYCDLICQELRDEKRIVIENDSFLAVIPFAPRFLFETWVIPKSHHADFTNGVKGHEGNLAIMLKAVLQKFKNGLDDTAYSLAVQTAPFHQDNAMGGEWQTTTRNYHWHLEIVPRLTCMAGFEKGSGFYICAIPPEDMAQYLREELEA